MDERIRVAIADDNEEFCLLLADYFTQDPRLKVIGIAHEGRHVLDLLAETPADVLLLDLVMPNMDGLSVLASLRQDEAGPRPRVIVFTAFGHEDMTRKAVQLGADYYIIKPFDLVTLARRIMEVAGEKKARTPHAPSLEEAECETARIIQRLRIPSHFKGHLYLREAILLAAVDATMITEITKKLYPRIAEKFTTTSGRVERAMRFAIETAWSKGDLGFLHELFGYAIDERKGKPTNASFIAKIADHVRLEILARRVGERSGHGSGS